MENDALEAAARLQDRLDHFFFEVLTAFPRVGRPIAGQPDLRQVIVPGTKIVAHYHILSAERIIVTALWHGAQDRDA